MNWWVAVRRVQVGVSIWDAVKRYVLSIVGHFSKSLVLWGLYLDPVCSPVFPGHLCLPQATVVLIPESRKLEFVFCQAWWFVCHHWQRELFCWLSLYRFHVFDSGWYSYFLVVVFRRITIFWNLRNWCFFDDSSLDTLTLFFFFTIKFLDCVELRSQANKLFDDFTTSLIFSRSWNFLVYSCWNAWRMV